MRMRGDCDLWLRTRTNYFRTEAETLDGQHLKAKSIVCNASKQRRSHHHSLHIMISLYGFRRRDIFFRYALGTKKGWQFLLLTIHCMSNSSMNTIATTATARVQFWSLSLYSRFVHTSIHYTNTDTRQCTIICIHTIYTLCANVYDTCACILLHIVCENHYNCEFLSSQKI